MRKRDMLDEAIKSHISLVQTELNSLRRCTQPGDRVDCQIREKENELQAYTLLLAGNTTRAKKYMTAAIAWHRSAMEYGP